SSGASNGWTGVGWSLDQSSIQTVKDPLDPTKIAFFYSSPSGGSSILVEGQKPGEYLAKFESAFNRFVRHQVDSQDWWEVTDRLGRRAIFGRDPTTFRRSSNASGAIIEWRLSRITDLSQNFISYAY